MNPRRLGKLDNHNQEPWKASLPIFIEDLYQKRFGRDRPEVVRSIEKIARLQQVKKRRRREERAVGKVAVETGKVFDAGAEPSPQNKTPDGGHEPALRSGPRR